MNDVLGQAIFDYYRKEKKSKLWIHNKYGPKEEMPVNIYFRQEKDMPELEWLAMENCRGKILDIGAGAGSHALLLQQQGKDVTALEISPLASEVMRLRGVQKIITEDIFKYSEEKFDTLLLLMNGIGLAGTIGGLDDFLDHAKTILNEGGQLLFDSSDVAYLYERNLPKDDKYYGEIAYKYEYKKQKTDWFSWLYIDRNTLTAVAQKCGWKTELLGEDDLGQYLVRLTLF